MPRSSFQASKAGFAVKIAQNFLFAQFLFIKLVENAVFLSARNPRRDIKIFVKDARF